MDRKKMYSFVVAFVCVILMGILVLIASITSNAQAQPETQPEVEASEPVASPTKILVGIPETAYVAAMARTETASKRLDTETLAPNPKAITDQIDDDQSEEKELRRLEQEEEEVIASIEANSTKVESDSTDTSSSNENAEEVSVPEEEEEYHWDGPVLNAYVGVVQGPSGKETYYNLPMDWIISYMRSLGYDEENYPYYIREDGCKMLGDYIMVAANLELRPRGTIVETSLGLGIVADTGGFASSNPTQLDIAVNW